MTSGFAGLGTVSISQASFSMKPLRPFLSTQEASLACMPFPLSPPLEPGQLQAGTCAFLSEPSTSSAGQQVLFNVFPSQSSLRTKVEGTVGQSDGGKGTLA